MKLFKSLRKTMIALIAGVTVSTAAAAGIGGLSVQKYLPTLYRNKQIRI